MCVSVGFLEKTLNVLLLGSLGKHHQISVTFKKKQKFSTGQQYLGIFESKLSIMPE